MKRERRHELHTNALARWLAGVIAVVKPYANLILAVVLLAVLVSGVAAWWVRHSAGSTDKAWDAFYRATAGGSPGAFEDLVDKYPGTEVAHWSGLMAGDIYLQQGCDQVIRDKVNASQQLQKARDAYLQVLREAQQSMLREQATFGLARTYEALSGTRGTGNELQQAAEQYENLVDTWPNSPYVPAAKRRLEELGTMDTKRFYDKLAQYEPKSVYAEGPGGKPLPSQEAVPEEPAPKVTIRKPGGSLLKVPEPKPGQPQSKPSASKTPEPGAAKPAAATEKQPQASKEPATPPKSSK